MRANPPSPSSPLAPAGSLRGEPIDSLPTGNRVDGSRIFRIRGAWSDEIERATSLFHLPQNCLAINVALIGPRERIVGCSALIEGVAGEDNESSSPTFLLWRRTRGRPEILLPLMEAAVSEARARGLSNLVTLDFLSEFDPACDSLARVGFRRTDQLHEVAVPMSQAHDRVCATYDRLVARGAIPADVRIATLEVDLIPGVRRLLHLADLLNAVDFDARLTGRATTTLSPEECTVIVEGDLIVGILLMEKSEDGFLVPCRWVRPGHRAGWVNVALMQWSIRRAAAIASANCSLRFSFSSKNHRETQRLAARVGAKQAESRTRWSHQLLA